MADQWTTAQVKAWLNKNGFGCYNEILCDTHGIDGKALLMIKESDLRGPPISMQKLGDIKRLFLAIHSLQREHLKISSDQPNHDKKMISYLNHENSRYQRLTSESLLNEEMLDGQISETLHPEIWKTTLSFVYVFSVFLLTSFVMVIVHDQVPDMEKFPPLPDLFLDNVPLIPKAFEICEAIIVILSTLWGIILVFHKHRFILLRRFFSLFGTVFLLRCVTMLITSLSVPGVHLNCKPHANKDLASQFWRAVGIWKCLGMSIHGARSCGDYMFSGHTVTLTLFNFFITEYTSRRLYYLHTLTWILNMFGMFFILAGHEHYSIDVFIAFYISSRLFLYYHTLANNRRSSLAVNLKTRINFPLFAFFESKCCGAVPNEFEWPLPYPKDLKVYFNSEKQD